MAIIGNIHTNFVKFSCMVIELYELTDRQRDRYTHHNTLYPCRQ